MASRLACPFMVDWNGDGLLDLLVGEYDGTVRFWIKSPKDNRLYYQSGAANPFSVAEKIEPDPELGYSAATPVVVDWDMDGKKDFILVAGGRIRFFKQNMTNQLEEVVGEKNPFHDIHLGWTFARVSIVDWDGDGDLDLIAPSGSGVAYWEQINGKLVLRAGQANPFLAVKSHFIDNARGWDGNYGAPTAVDWDGDGDLDLILGQADGTLLYFERMENAHLAERSSHANPFNGIQSGSYVTAQAVDVNGNGFLDLVLGSKEGFIHIFKRQRDYHLRERRSVANPFYDIGALRSAVPAAPLVDEMGNMYFMFQETNVGSVQLFRMNQDGSFDNLTQPNPLPIAAQAVWLRAGQEQILDWNGDGSPDSLNIFYNGTILYKQNISGKLVEMVGPASPFYGIRFGSSISDANVSGFLPLDLNRDGHPDLLVAEWGVKELRYFETAWCELADPCNNRGVCLKSSGQCSCMLGYQGTDCSSCSDGFFTIHSNKRSDYPGFACHACPGQLTENGTCSGRGLCFDDDVAKDAAQAEENQVEMSRLQLAFLYGNGTCTCSKHFTGDQCERGVCPSGLQYMHDSIVAHCRECEPGQFKPEFDNNARCRECALNHYAPDSGSAKCYECIGNIFIYSVNKEQTQCSMDVAASLPILINIICWGFIFYFAPLVFGLPVVVADISKQAGGIRVVSHGNHNLMRGQRATVRFWGTGDPRLDTKQYDFKVEYLSNNELVLHKKDGSPVLDNHQSSSGRFQVKPQQAWLRTGMFQVPYLAWALLPGVLYAGLLHYQNISDKRVMPSYSSLHVAIGCMIGIISHGIRYRQLSRTRLRKDIQSFVQELLRNNPKPVRCPRGPSRAIRAGQLWQFFDFFGGYTGPGRTMYYVCHNIILPLTCPFKLSYAELAGPTDVRWFVSHYWGTPFSHFVSTVCKHAQESFLTQSGCDDSISIWQHLSYWVCSFSNNQWAVEEEVGKNWDESSFYLAMRSVGSKGTVMVFDEEALPLTRSWCLFELLQTQQLSHERPGHFLGLMLCSPLGVMNNGNGSMDLAMNVSRKLASLRLEDASASKASDKAMIDNLVTGYNGGFSKINAFLIHSVREVLQATQIRFKDDLESLQVTLDAAETREFKSKPSFSDVVPVEAGNNFSRPRIGGWLRKAYAKTKMLDVFHKKGSSGTVTGSGSGSLFGGSSPPNGGEVSHGPRPRFSFLKGASGSSIFSSPKDEKSGLSLPASPKENPEEEERAELDLEAGNVDVDIEAKAEDDAEGVMNEANAPQSCSQPPGDEDVSCWEDIPAELPRTAL